MKVSFQFTIDDFVDVAFRSIDTAAAVQGWQREAKIVTASIAALIGYLLAPGTPWWSFGWAIVAAVVVWRVYPKSFLKTRNERMRQLLSEKLGSDGPFTCEVELTPTALVTDQNGVHSERQWRLVSEIVDRPDSVDFHTRGAGIVVVRNRAFASSGERQRFLDLARQYRAAVRL